MSSQTVSETDSCTVSSCPECGGRVEQTSRETHCRECGLVVDEQQIDYGPEWRSFEEEERRRTGAPRTVTRHDKGLSTEIGRDQSDANGTALSAGKKRRLSRQRRLHSRAKFESKRQRNLAHGLGEIRRLAGALSVSSVVKKQASSVFRTAQDADLLIGRSIEGGAGAAVYIACRCNTVLEMERVAEVAHCSETKLWTTYKAFQRELSLAIPLQEPVEWVSKILSRVPRDAPPALGQLAQEYGRAATEASGFAGKPACVAAGCVYLASQKTGHEWTQGTVAEAADVSDFSIRKWYQEVDERLTE